MSLIACSRGGIMETEMLELLRRKEKNEDMLPQAVWSRIYSSIQAVLRPSKGEITLDFFHKEIFKSVHKRYMEFDQEQEMRSHKLLAEFFFAKADPGFDGTWKGDCIF